MSSRGPYTSPTAGMTPAQAAAWWKQKARESANAKREGYVDVDMPPGRFICAGASQASKKQSMHRSHGRVSADRTPKEWYRQGSFPRNEWNI